SAPVERGEVEGVVRRGGQPLSNVLVTFVRDAGAGQTPSRASGVADAQGRFRLCGEDQQDGAAVGAYVVIVEDLAIYSAPRWPAGTVLRPPPARFSTKYRDPLRTPLRQVVRAGTQTVEVNLANVP